MQTKARRWYTLALVVVVAVLAGVAAWPKGPNIAWPRIGLGTKTQELKVRLGLDLQGGTSLTYVADLSSIAQADRTEAMQGVRDVMDRRVNALGVSEPVINVVGSDRLLIELPGVSDVQDAIDLIGKTPVLDFREESSEATATPTFTDADGKPITTITGADGQPIDIASLLGTNFKTTGLNGTHLKTARVIFSQRGVGKPEVSLTFDAEGKKMFKEITERNIGKRIAIFLDGVMISQPVVQAVISDGEALISGNFTTDEAKELARDLQAGALPVPISLESQQTVGASLGKIAVEQSFVAGVVGLLIVMLVMIATYRLPGVFASVALLIYALIFVALLKIFAITLTLAGVAGFILSIGMAVDANVLIFEHMRETLRKGTTLPHALEEGFSRAYLSIRDSNVSILMTAIVLYIFGSSLVRGFAMALGLGIVVSLFTALTVTRTFLEFAVARRKVPGWYLWLFGYVKKHD